jgi:hypothetical protein
VVDLAVSPNAICRCLFGPAVQELIASRDSAGVLEAESEAIAWYARHGDESEAAAAACRAWYWHDTGVFGVGALIGSISAKSSPSVGAVAVSGRGVRTSSGLTEVAAPHLVVGDSAC